MVKGLHDAGLRVVQDVVFNHTYADGENTFSILDEIVPGYYYRLDNNGNVETASCCYRLQPRTSHVRKAHDRYRGAERHSIQD